MCWLWVLFFLVVFSTQSPGGNALKCYLCSTKTNETGCLYPESYDMPLVHCDQTALARTKDLATAIDDSYRKIFEVDTTAMSRHIDLDCLKVAVKLGNRVHTFRGCQLAEQTSLDICNKIQIIDTEFLKRQHCSRCSADRCNSSNKNVVFFFTNVVLFVVVLFVINI